MERLRRALKAVSDAVDAFSETTLDHVTLLETVARSVADVVPNACWITAISDGIATPVVIHASDAQARDAFPRLAGKAMRLGETALRGGIERTKFLPQLDLGALPFHPDSRAFLQAIGARGIIIVPLKARRQLVGVLTVARYAPDLPALDETDCEIVQHLASHATLALANARLARTTDEQRLELEASRFLEAIIDNIPNMVFVKDAAELRFVRFNRAGEQLLGLPSSALLGKNDFDFFPADEAEFFTAKDRETLVKGALVDIPEEPIDTRHGQRWLHTKKVPIVDPDGTPRYLLGISEDITERKRADAALQAAKDKAEAASRELEAFSYSVAHDLRAPLRAIDGFAQALLEDYRERLDVTGQRYLERIRAAAQRMAMLIDDLLRLSRVTRAEHHPETVNLTALARITIEQLERTEPEREVEVVIEDDLEVEADPKLLGIVFDNLLGNAWKFTSKTERPRIEVGSARRDGELVFFIRDNGAGFDQAYASKLFGVFQRLHSQQEFPGTGIGLATVKRIIERHGGRIWAEGRVGQGATFYFTLTEVT